MDPNISLYNLITKLCHQILLEHGGAYNENRIKKSRAIAFETLLRSYQDYENPLKELNYYIFERQINATTSKEYDECDKLIEIYDDYENSGNFEDGILSFLLQIRDSVVECNDNRNRFFPLNLTINCKDNPYLLKPSKTKFFPLAEIPVEKENVPEVRDKFFALLDSSSISVNEGKTCDRENIVVENEYYEDYIDDQITIDGYNWENLGMFIINYT